MFNSLAIRAERSYQYVNESLEPVRNFFDKDSIRNPITYIALAAINIPCLISASRSTESHPWAFGLIFGATLLRETIQDSVNQRIKNIAWPFLAGNMALLYWCRVPSAYIALNFLAGAHLGSLLSSKLENATPDPGEITPPKYRYLPTWSTVMKIVVYVGLGGINLFCFKHKSQPWGIGIVLGFVVMPHIVNEKLTERVSKIAKKWIALSLIGLYMIQYSASVPANHFLIGAHLGSKLFLWSAKAPPKSPGPDTPPTKLP